MGGPELLPGKSRADIDYDCQYTCKWIWLVSNDMEEILYSIFGFLVTVGVLVTVHEWGHYAAARLVGVRVLKFSIGFGRSVWERSWGVDGTTYAVAILPLGGYVKMLGESGGDVLPGDEHRAFNKKPLWARAFVVSAGPVANLWLAVMIYWLVSLIGIAGLPPVVGTVEPASVAQAAGFRVDDRILTVNGRVVKTWDEHRLFMLAQVLAGSPLDFEVIGTDGENRRVSVDTAVLAEQSALTVLFEKMLGIQPRLPAIPAVVGDVIADSPAALGGLTVGDRILAIAGHQIDDWRELVAQISIRPDQEVVIEIDRQGMRQQTVIRPEGAMVNGVRTGRIGISVMDPGEIFGELPKAQYSVLPAFLRGLEKTWLTTSVTLRMAYRMIRRDIGSENLSGPITIGHFAGQSAQIGLVPFLVFMALVSVSLGVLNLLPIPVLDGGQLVYFLIEGVTGRPVPEKVMLGGLVFGWGLLITLILLALYNDVARLISL